MKKGVVFLIVLVALLSNVNGFESQDSAERDLRFELLRYDPSPIEAGKSFQATFEITNIDQEDVNLLKIRFADSFPIYLIDTDLVEISNLAPGEKYSFSKEFSVSAHAKDEGELAFQYERKGFDRIGAAVFDIDISNLNKNVEFDSIRTVPERIPPGEVSKVIVEFQNSANTALEEIELRLNVSDPFAMSGSTNERRINSLQAKESSQVVFEIIVEPDAEVGTYTIPLDITYFDSLRKLYSKSVSVGLVVDSPPDYELFVEESETMQFGSNPEITIALSNIGTSDIKFLTMELLDGRHYSVISNPRTYLGNLEPDDFETAQFRINLKNCVSCPEEVPLKVKLDYKDAFNKERTDERLVYEKGYRKNRAVALGLSEKSSGLSNLIGFLLVLIFLYLTYKEYKKTKDVGNSMITAFKKLISGILTLVVKVIRNLRWRALRKIPIKIIFFFERVK